MSRPFAAFGASHIAVLVLTAAVPLALAVAVRRSRSEVLARAISLLFAAILITTWAIWYWLIVSRGWVSPETVLPMNLCDWATITAVATLLKSNQRSYELAYFWALSGTLQALLTPELFYDFPDLRFIIFFAFHGGTIAAVLFLTLARGFRPYPSSLPRVMAWSLTYLALALAVNRLFGTNFGYLSAKPATPSLLDFLGPWPIYIAALAGLGIFYVLLLYAPFFVADRFERQRGPRKPYTF
ncbi:MAG TPA: TIGR02206 family membrane protein [Rhizomicrobium sp.]|jgi:hypothetical integral membrane protein (TIGR02206 family)|nr:TIGR02206 family membrane protein [Rhizomicrobium sp.]